MKKSAKFICLVSAIILCLCSASCVRSQTRVSDNLFDFTFRINDTVYTIPEKIETFTNDGWTFPEDFDEYDTVIKSGSLKTTYLSQGENWFNIEIFNKSEDELTLKECPIGRLTYNFEGDLKIYTTGDFLLNEKTLDEVVDKYGEPLSQADYSTYTEIIYDKDSSTGIYDRYTFRFDKDTKVIKYFDVVNFY